MPNPMIFPIISRTRLAQALVALALLAPGVASAQVGSIQGLFALIGGLFNSAIPVLVGAALVLFLYGLIKYVTAGDSGRDDAVQYIVWGIIALFVMVSVWGLVGILDGTFGLVGTGAPPLPQAP